ncbi:hypothetical protein LTR50_007427 [Elasticomyces elasticus]|nr:hypothetical protein LTR50_007427 [Elasticomyces elasticus]
MGYDYALVHLKYTVPPALLLTFLYRPLCCRLDVYKVLFLVTVAVLSTTPWDSYLIRSNIWTYPESVIVGPTLFRIPLEEVFFFIIQTYNTCLLYLILATPTFHPIYLRREDATQGKGWKYVKLAGQLGIALAIKRGFTMLTSRGGGTYMGLILVWAGPFLLLLWSLAYQFIVGLPLTNTLLPIAVPTLYLWLVDTLALRRGTWVIQSGTKLGIHLWPHLEIEEAVFFLLTNTLIVFGLVAFDNALAVLNTHRQLFPVVPTLPSPLLLVRALLLPAATYDDDRIEGFQQAVARLRAKSRSFYLASGVFRGRLRGDLITLYSFCRVADDLIDNAGSVDEARHWIEKLGTFLDYSYNEKQADRKKIASYIIYTFPKETQLALFHLPTDRLSPLPLYELLKGFEMDLEFPSPMTSTSAVKGKPKPSNGKPVANTHATQFPINTEQDLDLYASRVAGTVAEMCLELVLAQLTSSPESRRRLLDAGAKMGIALQYVNIARDIAVDAQMGRCYVPTSWLKKEKLTPEALVSGLSRLCSATAANDNTDAIERAGRVASTLLGLDSTTPYPTPSTSPDILTSKTEILRARLLDRAFALYASARPAIEELPPDANARKGMRVAVESYMEIGRVLRRKKGYKVKAGRATVGRWRRVGVAWWALGGGIS